MSARLLSARLLTLELGQQTEARVRNKLAGVNETVPLAASPTSPSPKRFSRVSGTRHKVSVFKVREKREPLGLSLRPWRGGWRLAFSRWKWNFRK